MSNYKKLLSNIRTFIFDVDGVLTDGIVLLLPGGEPLRTMNVKDGYALQLAIKKGFRIAIISGGKGDALTTRFNNLGINDVYLGVNNKLKVFQEYLALHNINPHEVLYMGDDIPDFQVMKEVGVATCPADAAEEIKSVSHYISFACGGKGCVRDIIEQVLKLQNAWFDNDGFHW